MKSITCCFTGHRKIPVSHLDRVREELKATVAELVQRGYTQFVAGGALGFDTLAAQVVTELKKELVQISLRLVLPCPEQSRLWTDEQKAIYRRMLDNADSVEYICDSYTQWCMAQRNRRMVELSSVAVAYYDGSGKGGTAMTVRLAEKNGLELINLF